MSGTQEEQYYRFRYPIENRSGLIGWLMKLSDWQMEKPFTKNSYFPNVLELGATSDWHLRSVHQIYDSYTLTDIIPIDSSNFASKGPVDNMTLNSACGTIKIEQLDATDLTQFPDSSFDRLIATCLIQHLPDPERALNGWRRVLKDGGYLSIYCHCEPGALLRFLRFFLLHIPRRFKGINHLDFVYSQHKIHFLAIKHSITKVFKRDAIRISGFPLSLLGWNFCLWKIYTIRVKKDV